MVKLSDIDLPVVFKNKLLFSKGNWNRWEITEEEVQKAFFNTDWEREKVKALYYQHKDTDAEKWRGKVVNQRYEGGDVYGDVEIWDAHDAIKLSDGKAPFAISAKIQWPSTYKDPRNFTFENFSLVADPGVAKESIYINFAKEGETTNEADILVEESNSQCVERGLSKSITNNMEEAEVKKPEVIEESKEEAVEEKQEAEFSMADFEALSARVAKLEEQYATFSAEEESKDEAPVEEEKTEEIVEEKVEEESAPVEEESKEEEVAEEVAEESKEEPEEEKEEAKEESEEKSEEPAKAEFNNEILNELKGIKEAIVSPQNTADFSGKVNGFNAALDRIEKE